MDLYQMRNSLALRGFGVMLLALSLFSGLGLDQTASAAAIFPGQQTRFKAGSYVPGQVLVKFKEPQGGKRLNNSDLKPERLLNLPMVQPYKLDQFFALRDMPGYFQYSADTKADMARLVTAISLDLQVEYVEPNYLVEAQRTPNDPLFTQTRADAAGVQQSRQWYFKKIGMESLWDVTTGNNQVIAILDTGVSPYHEDLKNKMIKDRAIDFTDFTQPDGKYVAIGPLGGQNWDDNGHGTAVAGIIAAKSNSGAGITGANWNSLLLSVKVLDKFGSGSVTSVAQGIVYAANNQARIINASFGGDSQSQVLQGAVEYAQTKGVLVVVSAGNNPDALPSYPASLQNVIAVGATDRNDKLAVSNSGRFISVAAPGVDIFTTYCFFVNIEYVKDLVDPLGQQELTQYRSAPCQNPNPNRFPGPDFGRTNVDCNNTDINSCFHSGGDFLYAPVSGTSFAAPIVVGLASLIIAKKPDMSNEMIKLMLESTADDIGLAGRDNQTGAGRVNATKLAAALNNNEFTPGSNSILQGRVTGANLSDVIVNLDPPNQTKPLDSNGGFRFENLAPIASKPYALRVSVPKRGVVLGPVLLYPNGQYGNVISVNFDVGSGTIICGERAVCPGPQNPAPGAPPNVPIPPQSSLNPNSSFFGASAPQVGALFFRETSHNLSGGFRSYWEKNGGLAVFGYPISEEFTEVSTTDGQTHLVQYFERNRFEFHPENDAANRVLLGLLGSESTRGRSFPPAVPTANTPTSNYFAETNHTLSDRFLTYWKNNGGLAIFGYPISEPLQEGQYLVQYFERNRFEFHPENAGTKYEVLLGLLGTNLARSRQYVN